MVSKEPNQLITGNTNSKSSLADKLPGTMTVRSVLLNRDSPDIESRLKRRRNRTHQVRFKDLEDGSSSSGNGGSKSHQRSGIECDSPHPLRKQNNRSRQGWTNRDGPRTEALPGQTSVVGAVRGDMAGTIEVVAAFLARAPPHPLTPGPTRRSWVPPQANSLTLPMTRKSSTSTSTAIQTSPCLKKPQSHSSSNTHRRSLGDSVGVDGDDEEDSQDEYPTNNQELLPGSRNEISPLGPRERTSVEQRVECSRTDDKAVAVVKKPKDSCPPPILHHTEPCYCQSVSCRDVSKRQGSITPSLVRRRKRLNRAISDPGKEVSFCTTQVQTESPCPSPPPVVKNSTTASQTKRSFPSTITDEKLCTTQCQTESPCPCSPPEGNNFTSPIQTKSSLPSRTPDEKLCTTQCQTESICPPPPLDEKNCNTQNQTKGSCPSPPSDLKHCTVEYKNGSPCASPLPDEKSCTTQSQTKVSFPPSDEEKCTTQSHTEASCPSSPLDEENCNIQSQTKDSRPSPPPDEKNCTSQSETKSLYPPPGPDEKHCTTQSHMEKPFSDSSSGKTQIQPQSTCSSPLTCQPCSNQTLIGSQCAFPPLPIYLSSTMSQSEDPCLAPSQSEDPHTTTMNTVPYLTPPQTTKPCSLSPCPSSATPACTTQTPSITLPSDMSFSTSAHDLNNHSIPYYSVVSPPQTANLTAASFNRVSTTACLTENCTSLSNVGPSTNLPCSTTTSTVVSNIILNGPTLELTTAPNTNTCPPPINASNTMPSSNTAPCTFVTQTALSCTSISYCTATHPTGRSGHRSNSTLPPYATIIQTVSHCNIPCHTGQNVSNSMPGTAPYSSPVPKLKTYTSPPLLVKNHVFTLQNGQSCATPTKTVPSYSSTFRAAPPYTPPSHAPYNSQDKRGVRLPPPPPPPPPYTPRKEDRITLCPVQQPPVLGTDWKASAKEKEKEKEQKDVTDTESPWLCKRASSLKHRATTPPVAVIKGEKQSSTLPAKACSKPSCLSSAQAQLGALHKMLCSGASARSNTPNSQQPQPPGQQACSGAWGCSGSGERPIAGPLTATQADTLRQVQEILGGLVSGARCKMDPSRLTEKLLSPNGPLHDIRNLQTQLQSLEGVLETSQNTIKVLLDVIQDLEKKEAERDGRHSYRTGQDIENCGTCRDCACIIYSVEHDFRLQEGQVVRTWKVGDPPEGSPPSAATPQPATPHRQELLPAVQPPAAAKKSRKKCFWFL